MNTIRVFLSLTVTKEWLLYQLDVKNAFLNGHLEEVYMAIPPGYQENMRENKVCKLNKSLYGLKQSPRAWFERFTKAIRSQGDHTLFIKHSERNGITALIVYVDAIVVTGEDNEEIVGL